MPTENTVVQGVKMSDTQATSHGMVSAGLFFVISSAKPLQTLSAERPHTRIFCVYVFASLMGQFVVNTAYLIYMYSCAIAMMPAVSPIALCDPVCPVLQRLLHIFQVKCPVVPAECTCEGLRLGKSWGRVWAFTVLSSDRDRPDLGHV